jgi:hypothetical protein
MKDSIFRSLAGKKNPRTGKPYTEDEKYAIAVAAYKKKYGHAPARESLSFEFKAPLQLVEHLTGGEKEFKGVYVGGTAVTPTVSANKILYEQEDLEPATKSMVGRKILKDHKRDVDNTIGVITDAWYENGIQYKGKVPEIDSNKDIIDKIRTGIVNEVSIGASVKELKEVELAEGDEKIIVFKPVGLSFEELSLTPTPGVSTASISLLHALTEAIQSRENALKENWNAELAIIESNVKGEDMEENDKNKELDELRAFKAEKVAEAEKAKFKEELLKELKAELIGDEEPDKEEEEKAPEEPKPEESKLKGIETKPDEEVKEKFVEIKTGGALPKDVSKGSYVYESQGSNKISFWKY